MVYLGIHIRKVAKLDARLTETFASSLCRDRILRWRLSTTEHVAGGGVGKLSYIVELCQLVYKYAS